MRTVISKHETGRTKSCTETEVEEEAADEESQEKASWAVSAFLRMYCSWTVGVSLAKHSRYTMYRCFKQYCSEIR